MNTNTNPNMQIVPAAAPVAAPVAAAPAPVMPTLPAFIPRKPNKYKPRVQHVPQLPVEGATPAK